MSKWKERFPRLYDRIKKAVDAPSSSAFDKRVTRTANKFHVSPIEGLFILASQQDINSLRESAKLSVNEQNRISQVLQSMIGAVPNGILSGKKKSVNKKEIVLKTPIGKIKDPYLPAAIFQDARQMSESTYPYLYIFENSLRNFINLVISASFGKKWWDTNMQSSKDLLKISGSVDFRIQDEERFSYHSKRGIHQLYYTDFGDLAIIMINFRQLFEPLFDNLPGGLDRFTNKLEEIKPSRNIASHHNPLSKRDLTRVTGYLHDWLDQLHFIKKQNLL